MAVEFVATVKSSGGDYSSLSAAESGLQNDLTASDTLVFSISAVGAGGAPTAGTAVTGVTSNATGVVVLVNAAETQCWIKTIASGPFQSGEVVDDDADATVSVTLSDAGDTPIAAIECYSFQDTTVVQFQGSETDATRYIRVYTPAAERHDGTWSTGKYYLSITDDHAITINDEFVRLEGLQAEVVSPTGNWRCVIVRTLGAPSSIQISACVFKGHNHGTHSQSALRVADADATVYAWNCIAFNLSTVAATRGYEVTSGTLSCYSCVAIGGADGFAGAITAKNCYAGGGGTTDFNASVTLTTCASSDTTGSAGLQNIAVDTGTFQNVTGGSEDYHLADESPLRGAGTDTSGDAAPLNFTDDIDADTRDTGMAWHIGADHADLVTITKTVKSSGGDFSSLSAWESDQQADIRATNQIRQAECYSFQDTTKLTIVGWTTDATRYIRIYTPTAERHAGVWDTSKFYMSVTDDDCVNPREEYVRLEGLQLECVSPTAASTDPISLSDTRTASSNETRISACLLKGHASDTHAQQAIVANLTNLILKVWNTIIYAVPTVGASRGMQLGGDTIDVYSCTIIGGDRAILRNSGTVTCKNCYAGGAGTADYSGTMTLTTCASSDTTGSAALQSIPHSTATFVNVTGGSEDYRLASGSALIGVGVDTRYENPEVENGVLDNFNRGDEDPATGWTWASGSEGRVVSNQLLPDPSSFDYAGTYDSTPTTFTDCESYVTIATLGGSDSRINARANDETFDDLYFARLVDTDGTFGIWRRVSNSNTNLGSTDIGTPANGDALCLRVIGTRVEGWYKPSGGSWEMHLVVKDSNHASGKLGLQCFDSSGGRVLDDFGGGALTQTQAAPLDFSDDITGRDRASDELWDVGAHERPLGHPAQRRWKGVPHVRVGHIG